MKMVIASHWTTDGDSREHRPSAVLTGEVCEERSCFNKSISSFFATYTHKGVKEKKLQQLTFGISNIDRAGNLVA